MVRMAWMTRACVRAHVRGLCLRLNEVLATPYGVCAALLALHSQYMTTKQLRLDYEHFTSWKIGKHVFCFCIFFCALIATLRKYCGGHPYTDIIV